MDRTFAFALGALVLAGSAAAQQGGAPAAPPAASHPKEVALVDEEKFGSVYREATMSLRLYTHDADPPGVSTCVSKCAAAWPPLRAPADATPIGEWSVVRRPYGFLQWAFRGKPVHLRFHDTPADPTGVGIAGWSVIPYFSRVATEITRDQALAATGAIWDVIDANQDGAIDVGDRDVQRDLRFAQLDTDRNGELSRPELGAGSAEFRSVDSAERLAWFARLDADANGGLSRAELVKGGAGQLPAETSPRSATVFAMADANRDKKVTRAEFDAIVGQLLTRVDSNRDGKISKAEHEAGRRLFDQMVQAGQKLK